MIDDDDDDDDGDVGGDDGDDENDNKITMTQTGLLCILYLRPTIDRPSRHSDFQVGFTAESPSLSAAANTDK